MKNLNSEHLSMIAAMVFGSLSGSTSDRAAESVDLAKRIVLDSQRVAQEHNRLNDEWQEVKK